MSEWARKLRQEFDQHIITTKEELVTKVLREGEKRSKNHAGKGKPQYWVTYGIHALFTLTKDNHWEKNKDITKQTKRLGRPKTPGMWEWDMRGCNIVEADGTSRFRIRSEFYNAVSAVLTKWHLP